MWSLQTRKSVKTITTGEALEGLQVCTRRAPVAPFSHTKTKYRRLLLQHGAAPVPSTRSGVTAASLRSLGV